MLEATSLTVDHTLHIKVSKVYAEGDEDALTLLDRLDRAELISQ
jgi:hypothetical protein